MLNIHELTCESGSGSFNKSTKERRSEKTSQESKSASINFSQTVVYLLRKCCFIDCVACSQHVGLQAAFYNEPFYREPTGRRLKF